MKNVILTLLMVISPVFLFSQVETNDLNGKISPYTGYFLNTLNETQNDSLTTVRQKKKFAIAKVGQKEYINAFIELNNNADLDELRANGAEINTVTPSIITARIPLGAVESIASLQSVKRLQIGTPVHKKMNAARIAANVNKVQAGTDLTKPYTGKGVVVGILDSGFEYGHIDFYNMDRTALRVKKVWNQNATTGTKPTGYSYGAEYATEASILSAKYDTKSETHGTHVAGIAAGADTASTYYGVAPDADLIFVSYNEDDQSTDNVSLADGIKYVYDYATSVNKPSVVNMSLGSHIGPHDGTSLFDIICDNLQGQGRLLVGAAGNEGNTNLHMSKTFSTANDSIKSFINFLDSNNKYSNIDIWGDAGKTYKIRVVVYKSGTELFSTGYLDASQTYNKKYSLTTSSNGASGKIYVYTERNPVNNKANTFITADITSISSGNYIGIVITASDGSTVHAWADGNFSYFGNNSVSGWYNGDANYTIGEIGGTGKKIISVGAFSSKSTQKNISGATINTGYTVGDVVDYSSIGPTLDGRIKPDITAPGSLLVSAYSYATLSDNDYKNYYVKKSTINGTNYYYGGMEGTSMATPFVTGVLATWLEAKSDLTPDEVRSIFKKTAIKDTYTGNISENGSNTWGYGKIDAWNGIKECISMSGINNETAPSTTASTVIYPNPNNGEFKVLFIKNDNNIQISVYSLNGQKVYSKPLGDVFASQEQVVNLHGLDKGIYVVSVKGDNQNKNYRLIIQ